MWFLEIEKKIFELVREEQHIWDPRSALYSEKSLCESLFDEIAATLQELFPSMQSGVGGKD
ncbi:hypothetical protein E2C01_020352 [Portunus trituberculatus]|uniref:MADF domain-containing protein n=1 Tax=Portunus trituberculatus TaxID=210409 RepID=A0A5B7E214_PORTR|nr:hypothetical protein [Portunus trituberculatus]